ncbi:27461_t:CDS:2, partial [Gigaspora margarita]
LLGALEVIFGNLFNVLELFSGATFWSSLEVSIEHFELFS